MLASAIPTKFPIPFGNNAAGGTIRAIPVASQIGIVAGAASLTDGFPPVTLLPVGAGGTPPFAQDMNGILFETTAWSRWQAAGGPVVFDLAFQTAIGGYPSGAVIASATTFGLSYMSTVDNNLTNPDSGGANWLAFSPAGPSARIITTSGAFTITTADGSIGLARTSSPATSTAALPTAAAAKEFWIEDLAGNFNAFPVTITAPAGQTIAGESSITLNVNRQCARFKYYGSNLWSVKL